MSETSETNSTEGRDQKYIQNFGWKYWMESTSWKSYGKVKVKFSLCLINQAPHREDV
jgi:hypothetical protein